MVNDVETVLREIRERVIAENESSAPLAVISSGAPALDPLPEPDSTRRAALDRLSAQLAITARAWDRLPPLVSNRRGALRRFEVSIKKAFRPLTRWFTWEQVNFNAAVHHALLEALAMLRTQEQELAALRAAIASEAQTTSDLAQQLQSVQARAESQSNDLRALSMRHDEAKTQFAHIDATLRRHSEMMSDLAEEMRKGHADLTNDLQTHFPQMAADVEAGLQKLANDLDAKLAGISAELHEEQRVCFKQFSLETGEAAILEDRGRRALESRVEKLERDSRPSK
jgi:Mg2+ and Co2+ transporter CorA